MTLPLADVRILDFTQAIAGPYGVQLLAFFGAEVIKVESSHRPDLFRRAGYGVSTSGTAARTFNEFNRNKRDVTINMSTPDGAAVARRLAAVCDVVVENFSLGVMERWGLNYKDLRKVRPDIIMLSMQGMGALGPRKHWVTWGPNLMPYSGLTWMWGHPGQSEPVGSQIAHPDYIVSVYGAIAILAALAHRRRTGEGHRIELAQVAGAASLLPTTFLDYSVNARVPGKQGNSSPHYAPYGVYRCADEDRWVAIACTTEAQWRRLCDAAGHREWAADPRFSDVLSRVKHRETLDPLLAAWTAEHDCHEVAQRLQSAGVPAGAVQDARDLSNDPHLRERGMLMELTHPEMDTLTYAGIPIKLDRSPAQVWRHAPLLGQDNDYVFREVLGMGQEEIDDLVRREVLV